MRLAPVTDLSGRWKMQPESVGLDRPKSKRWYEVPVPMPWSAFLYAHSGVPNEAVPRRMAWFRRSVMVPELPPLSRLVLHFEAVNFYAVVSVNGRRAGEHVGDAIPFDVDVTDYVTPRREAEILVGVQDISFAETRGPGRRRGPARLLYPGLAHHPGICGPVSLRIVPELHILHVGVSTTLSDEPSMGLHEGRVRVRVTVQNGTGHALGFSLTNEVYDGARQVIAFAPIRGAVGPGETTEIEMGTAWDAAALWWPDYPHLYTLRTALWSALAEASPDGPPETGDVVDRVHTAVGFREFRVKGRQFLLNNVPIQLRSESLCPISGRPFSDLQAGMAVSPVEPEQAREMLAELKKRHGVNAVRFHRMPPSPALLDAADAAGLLVVVEFPLPDDEQRLATDDPRFWVNAQQLVREWVTARLHHPSVIIWSIDQGMIRRYGKDVADPLQSMVQYLTDLDPTRPVECGGDGLSADGANPSATTPVSVFFPPSGVAFRTASPYQPESVRDRVLPCPNTWPKEWLPERPSNRPLCLLEHTRTKVSPNHLAFFLGDAAYATRAVDLAEAAAIDMLEMGACRMAGLSAINTIGRSPAPQGVGDAAGDIVALPKHLFANFYAGTRLVESLVLRNDTRYDQDIELSSSLITADGESADQTEELLLAAGSQEEKSVAFELPDLPLVQDAAHARSTLAELSVSLLGTRAGSFQHRRKLGIWPHIHAEGSRRVGLYDPDGRTAAALSAVGTQCSAATRTPHHEFDIIIIGENALEQGSAPDPEAIRSFVAEGGLAVFLAQRRLPYDLSPVQVVIDEQRAASITFVRDGEHPVFRGLTAFEMRWWQDDHRVASNCLRKPAFGNFRCLADAGGPGGLRWTTALEVFHGRGSYLFSQMELVAKAARCPVAGVLLARLAEASPAWVPAEARTMEGDDTLAMIGVRCPTLSRDFSADDLESVQVTALTGSALSRLTNRQIEALRGWVEHGGTLSLHHLTPEHGTVLTALSGRDVDLEDAPQQRLVFSKPGTGLARGLSSADLFFTNHGARYLAGSSGQVNAADVVAQVRGDHVTGVAAALESPVKHALFALQTGKGRVIVDQVRWDVDPWADSRSSRYISTLFTNLGVTLAAPQQAEPSDRCRLIDITPACNTTLIDPIPADRAGWTDRGPDSDLGSLTPGLLLATGIPFRIADGSRGTGDNCCVLGPSTGAVSAPIDLNRKARSLAFLIASEGHLRHGVPIGHMTVRYEDGLETQIPLRSGIDVLDWNERARHLENAKVAWKGFTALGEPATVYMKKWENNRPAATIRYLAFSSTRAGATPALLAVTALS